MIKYVFFFYKKIVLKEVSFTSTNTIYYRPQIKSLDDFFIKNLYKFLLNSLSQLVIQIKRNLLVSPVISEAPTTFPIGNVR